MQLIQGSKNFYNFQFKSKYIFIFWYILPISLSNYPSHSLSLSLSLIACWFKPLVQTSDDYWQGSPPLPPRPPSTQNFNCQKIIMDTNRLGTIMSCKPTKKLFVLFKLNILLPLSSKVYNFMSLKSKSWPFLFFILPSGQLVVCCRLRYYRL